MSANTKSPFEFDPYKRPPAARLLAILLTGVFFGWILHGGDRTQMARFRRDPASYAKYLDKVASHGIAFDVIAALIFVTIIVFAVDGLTSLFSRWLTEREHPAEAAAPASPPRHHSGRADALLGRSDPPPPPES